MSIQDEMIINFNLNEFDKRNYNFNKEMDEINNLIEKLNLYRINTKSNDLDFKQDNLINYYVFIYYFIYIYKYEETHLVEFKKYYYNNIFYDYLNLIDFYVKLLLKNILNLVSNL